MGLRELIDVYDTEYVENNIKHINISHHFILDHVNTNYNKTVIVSLNKHISDVYLTQCCRSIEK